MTPEQFCYWLQGFIELAGDDLKKLDEKRIQIIKDHLDLVFNKVTPDRSKRVITEEKKKDKGLEDLIKAMKEPKVYCDPYTMPGKIC